jgi:hypothetical protein
VQPRVESRRIVRRPVGGAIGVVVITSRIAVSVEWSQPFRRG